MWLQRSFDIRQAARVVLVAAVLVLAGCATIGLDSDTGGPSGKTARGARGTTGRDVSPQALTMFEQATATLASGDLFEAELRFNEFVLRYPDYPGAHVNLAIIHSNNGDDAAAQTAVDDALALNPDYAPALNQQGMLFRRNGNFFEAEAAYLKAVTAWPDYALAHYNLGVLNELYLQRLEAALRHFERYQELAGEDKQVKKWIADLRRRVAADRRTANVAE